MILLMVTGRIGGDAEVQKVNEQYAIRFSVCHSYAYKTADGTKVDASVWVRCTFWKKDGNIAQYLRKGDVVGVTGAPAAHAWRDSEGKLRAQLELTVKDLDFLYSKPKETPESNTPTPTTPAPTNPTATANNEWETF